MKSWLLSELQAAAAPPDQARFALDLSETEVALVDRTARGERARRTATLGAPGFDEAIGQLRRRVGGRGEVDLLLPEPLTLFKIETFPGEARRNLREEAWWRLDSLTPYAPEDLCYDVALLGSDPNTGFLEVHIAVAPREIVDEAVRHAQAWGFTPRRITASAAAVGFPAGPEFLRATDRSAETRSLRKGAAALAAAAVLFGAIGLARGVFEREALAAEATQSRAAAEDALEARLKERGATLDLARRALTPSDLREARPLTVDLMSALAKALPPRTRTDRVLIADGGLRLEGVAENAAAVLSAVALAPEFEAARHAAPIRPVRAGGRRAERFAIEARIVGGDARPAPAPAPSAEAAP